MSVVFMISPEMLIEWASFAMMAEGAAKAAGYVPLPVAQKPAETGVKLVMEETDLARAGIARGEAFAVERDGLVATFRRDGRGRCLVHVDGRGRSEVELEAAGRELMDRVRREFAYSRVREELDARGFDVVEEEAEADGTVRLRVRRWN